MSRTWLVMLNWRNPRCVIYEPYELSLPFKCQRYGVVEAIIECYHSNVSVDRTLKFLREAGIHSYTTARIKKLIKIYLDLKKKGESFNFTDIELLEGPVGGAKSAAKSGSRSSAKGREASAVDTDDDSEDLPEVDFDEPLPEYVDDSVKMNREEKKLIADALPIFSTLNAHVMVVGKGLSPALLVTGPGGIGKSFSVEKILSHFGKKNKDFVIMKGKCTPSAITTKFACSMTAIRCFLARRESQCSRVRSIRGALARFPGIRNAPTWSIRSIARRARRCLPV